MSERPPLIWVVPKWPFPMEDGARVATVQLVRNLSELGHPIHLVALVADNETPNVAEATSKLGVRKVSLIRRSQIQRKGLIGPLRILAGFASHPWDPITMQPYAQSEVRRQFAAILRESEGVLVYDGLHPAAHGSRFGRYDRPKSAGSVIYRAHNYEAAIWYRKAAQTSSAPMRAFFNFQAAQVNRFELSLLHSANGVAPVSEDDFQSFKKICPSVKGRVVPIGYDFDAPLAFPISPSPSLPLMFLGRMDWPPNREGLSWFLEKVWPEAVRLNPQLDLSIAGSGDSSWLEPHLKLKNLKFLGRVADVEDLYRKTILSLVPVFYGSGTRVKVIEACRFGRACLSTALGVEGTGLVAGESYIRAEEAQEWIRELQGLDLEKVRSIGLGANECLKKIFDAKRTAQQFSELVTETRSQTA